MSRPNWTTARRQLETKSIKGVFDFDVVNEASFSEYVADLLEFAAAIAAVVGADPLTCTGERWELPMLEPTDP